jgi:hypothetical protein
MKANEMRIGNWVLIPRSLEGVIIPSVEKQVKGIGIFGGIDFTEASYLENHIIPAVHCVGIPLTEEWLKKFGFRTSENSTMEPLVLSMNIKGANKNEIFCLCDSKKKWWACATTNGYWSSNNVEYIHQLQNLYFVLTGEELTID